MQCCLEISFESPLLHTFPFPSSTVVIVAWWCQRASGGKGCEVRVCAFEKATKIQFQTDSPLLRGTTSWTRPPLRQRSLAIYCSTTICEHASHLLSSSTDRVSSSATLTHTAKLTHTQRKQRGTWRIFSFAFSSVVFCSFGAVAIISLTQTTNKQSFTRYQTKNTLLHHVCPRSR